MLLCLVGVVTQFKNILHTIYSQLKMEIVNWMLIRLVETIVKEPCYVTFWNMCDLMLTIVNGIF